MLKGIFGILIKGFRALRDPSRDSLSASRVLTEYTYRVLKGLGLVV